MRNIFIVLSLFLLVFSVHAAENKTMAKPIKGRGMGAIKHQYKDPWIGEFRNDPKDSIEGLRFFQACERRRLNEDPVHTDYWILTQSGKVFKGSDIISALNDVVYVPENDDEAIMVATAVVQTSYEYCDVITGTEYDKGLVPGVLLEKTEPPQVVKNDGIYTVTLYASHYMMPRIFGRKPQSYYLYQYIVTLGAGKHMLASKQIGQVDMKDIALLEKIIVEHICQKDLFKDLASYRADVGLYGLIDPPDPGLCRLNREKLDKSWEDGFKSHRQDIVPLLKKVLKLSPDFVFDAQAIFAQTKDCPAVKDIEYYELSLSHILGDILWREGNRN